ncbi:MAG TPA: ATP-dependent Clp protease proteolytic subunit, partial [Alphaproteobacteria bacterium]
GKRFAMPNSTIMVHGPSGGTKGDSIDMNIDVKEMNRLKARMIETMSAWTGLSEKKVRQMMTRDHYMPPEMAMANGLVDGIIEPKHKPPTHKSEAEKAFDTLPPFTPAPGTVPSNQPVMH